MASRGRLLGRKLRQPFNYSSNYLRYQISKQSAGKQTCIVPVTQFVLNISEVRPGVEAQNGLFLGVNGISSEVLFCVIPYMLIVGLTHLKNNEIVPNLN
jgi:hypothetical protein